MKGPLPVGTAVLQLRAGPREGVELSSLSLLALLAGVFGAAARALRRTRRVFRFPVLGLRTVGAAGLVGRRGLLDD